MILFELLGNFLVSVLFGATVGLIIWGIILAIVEIF